MAIWIKDMATPLNCGFCPFEVNGDCYGGKAKRIMDIEDYRDALSRHPDCPLVELDYNFILGFKGEPPQSCERCIYSGYKDTVYPMRVCFLEAGPLVPDNGVPKWCPFKED